MKVAKKQKEVRAQIKPEKKYSLDQALDFVQKGATAKFDETVDAAIRLGVDAKQSNQQVRGAVVLPHGLGKTVRVLVFAKGEKDKEAREAGADFVGADDVVEKINGGWMDFDAVIATPDMMGLVGKIGKVLGPRGLMPNPKLGTVTFDVKKAIQEVKSGKVEFRTEKAAIIHVPIGKVSFGKVKLQDNLKAILENVRRLKPASAKGIYFKGLSLSSTVGPCVRIDMGEVSKIVEG